MRNSILISLVPIALGLAACAPQQSKATSQSSSQPSSQPSSQAIPAELKVAESNEEFLRLLGRGVQIYTCKTKADNSGFEWVFKSPEAVLLDNANAQVGTHYAGPTWEGNDKSKVIGERVSSVNSPDSSAIPWLLLKAKSTEGAGVFSKTMFIQRLETTGGKAPGTGCDASKLDAESRVNYTAIYAFFKAK
jgi:Protein of unknown function (DUF3455)